MSNTESTLQWGAPPPSVRPSKYRAMAALLDQNPGQWAFVGRGKGQGYVASVRTAFAKCGTYEVTGRRANADGTPSEDGTWGVWARALPQAAASASVAIGSVDSASTVAADPNAGV